MEPAEREQWRQADRILDEILDLPPGQRPEKLAALAPDPELRQIVQRLLAAHAEEGGLLEHPMAAALLPEVHNGLTGRRLGRWRLLEEIGRGGMAVVYRAIADEGDAAGQLAALKVLSLGTLATDGRERLVHEQQALLRLRHPYLAQLYDTGVAEDGTPWLAMALVEGERIDAWCEQRGLGIEARVRLVLQVCGALSYAHRNLVIHRDIKPSNVLVDHDGHVRLLDFGIARLTDNATDERTTTALRALTPEYAAPEQFTGALPSTAMDVYGLGALLYRLLTELPPRPRNGGVIGPPTQLPSRAVRAAAQVSEPERRHRAQRLRGDLDTVTMKALAEKPDNRYASVEALAEDLRRWLSQRPIRAHPPSWRYRFGKFVVRHRIGVAASAMLLVALAAGIAGTLWQGRLARQEALRATAAAEQSQAQLVYLGSVLEVLAPTTEDARERDKRQLLAEIAQRAQREFDSRPTLLATVELSLGGVAERIGDYPQAADLYASALQRRRRLFGAGSAEAAEAQVHWGKMLDLRDPPDPAAAEAQLREATATLRRTRPASPLLVEALTDLAGKLGERDRYDEARALLAEASGLCKRAALDEAQICEQVWLMQGMIASRTQRIGEAIAPLKRLLMLRERRYGADHAQTLFARGELGKAYVRNGQAERGLAMVERVHAQQQRIYSAPTRETLRTLQDLSELLGELGRYDRALVLRERYIEQARALFGERHGDVAVGYANLGTLYFTDGRYADAAAAYDKARQTYAEMYDAQHAGAIISGSNYADALRELGRADEALPLQRAALDAIGALFGTQSARYASRLSNLARTYSDVGDSAQALVHYDRSLAIYRALQTPGQYHAAVVRAYRSQALLGLDRATEATREASAAIEEIATKAGREHRFYWEALAIHVQAACAAGNVQCAALRAQATRSIDTDVPPGGARLKLQAALAETDADSRR